MGLARVRTAAAFVKTSNDRAAPATNASVGRDKSRPRDRSSGFGDGLVAIVGRLMPSTDRERYIEEWRSPLYEMRLNGEPWRQRAAYVAGLLLTAPTTAHVLWFKRKEAIE